MSARREVPKPATARPVGPAKAEEMDRVTAALVGLGALAAEMEAKWGVGRLIQLCRDNARLGFRRGMLAFDQATNDGDADRMIKIIDGLKTTWRIMDAQAAEDGAAPLTPTVWETRLPDGRVLALVRTQAEAHAVARDDRSKAVYSLEEIARLLPSLDLLGAIKTEFPGAVVQKVRKFEEGCAESWAKADPLHEILHGDEAL